MRSKTKRVYPSRRILNIVRNLITSAKSVDGAFKLCAGAVSKTRLLASFTNSMKTHSISKNTRIQGIHAEMGLITALGDSISDYTLIVARWRHHGPGIAKPCIHCEKLLRARGVKKVIYTTTQTWEEFSLNPILESVRYI